MTRRRLLALLGGALALAAVGTPLASRALRAHTRGRLVRVGGPGGPQIRVIPLPPGPLSMGAHLAG